MQSLLEKSPAIAWLGTQQEAMLELLRELVNIDSGSHDPSGVDAVGRRLERFFDAQGIAVEWHGADPGCRSFSVHAGNGQAASAGLPGILLLGHRDTVFPQGEAVSRPFRIDGDRAYGPGVADMKSGLVMNAFVIAAFHRFGGLQCPLTALFTTDEEIGSPRSREVIARAARHARAVFNAEPARPSGNVVTGRKGGSFLRLTVHGRSAHSGSNFLEGISAIMELAHKIVALEKITDLARGVTLNVGIVRGGQSVNTVAPLAEGLLDLRYQTKPDRDAAIDRIQQIVQASVVEGTTAFLDIEGEFDAFVPTEQSARLFQIYQQAMQAVGVTVDGEFSGGCADSGITSQLGCPTVCAVGPVGGRVHTPQEYLDFHTMVPRAQGLLIAIGKAAAAF